MNSEGCAISWIPLDFPNWETNTVTNVSANDVIGRTLPALFLMHKAQGQAVVRALERRWAGRTPPLKRWLLLWAKPGLPGPW